MRGDVMKKFDRYFQETSSFITGTIFMVAGILFIIFNQKLYFLLADILIFLFLLLGIKNFIFYFLKKNKDMKSFREALFHLLFVLFLSFFPKIPYSILPIVMGLYFLLNGFLQIVDLVIILKNGGYGKFLHIFYIIFYFIAASVLVFTPLKEIRLLLILLGIYFLLMGIRFLADAIFMLIPFRYKNHLKRRIRISFPVILECFIPYAVLSEINESLRVDNQKMIYEEKKNDEHPDLEVIVHVSPNGFNRMGHVDIVFQGEVISYGNYDRSSMKGRELFGDGVIFITDKDSYIPFCIEHSKKTLFVFGLKLSEKQKNSVQKEINAIKKNLVRWYPPLELATLRQEIDDGTYKDYSSCLYRKTKAQFYKVEKGSFRTYFVLGNNCCLLADKIIGKSGIDILKMNGLITPGTYYDYLNREFMRKGSFVVSRNIYNEKRKRSKHERKQFKSKRK